MVGQFRQVLSGIYSPHEAYQFAWLIMDHFRGWTKTQMMLHEDTKLTLSEHLFVEKALERLKNHEPIQYITGQTEFYGLPFKVDPSVLIPRPETEEMVEWIWQYARLHKAPHLLDIGTGSGCIAIALSKHLPEASVEGWDVSPHALEVARENARLNQVNPELTLMDIRNAQPATDRKYDFIISNPPYVRDSEKQLIAPNVLGYEPHVALFVDDRDPLLFFRYITQYAQKALKDNGMLFFEINRDFGVATKELLSTSGFSEIELRKDLSGNHRMIKAVKPVWRSQESMG